MIEIKELSRDFGTIRAVDRISFAIDSGNITGFLGPNGAGKTTTLRMLVGYLQPSSGEILLDGKPVSGEQPELTQARGWEHQAHRLALRNELQMLQQEVASQDVRNELLQARRDQAAYEQGRLEAKRQAMEATINNLRLENAERAREEVQQTRESLRDQHPLVQKLAEENAKIASEMAELAGMRETVAATLARGRQGVEKIESELRGARLRFEVVGLSTALGRYLQESRPQAKELAKG